MSGLPPEQWPADGAGRSFGDAAGHGFLRLAAAIPQLRVADVQFNAQRTIELAAEAAGRGAAVVAFPELGLTAYTCEDLFHQDALFGALDDAVGEICAASAALQTLIIVGAPVRAGSEMFNAALAIQSGRVLGAVPKSYLPNYNEYYEKRHFRAERDRLADEVQIGGQRVPFGADLTFECQRGALSVAIEICEDLWAPIPPSTYAALAGATVIVNLSASNAAIAKARYRRLLCASHSGRAICAYLYVSSGAGESGTDLAWEGDALIYENGNLLAASERFGALPQLICGDVDIDRLRQDRMRVSSFADCASDHGAGARARRNIVLPRPPQAPLASLERGVDRFPYVPHERRRRDERCAEVFAMQVEGLAGRMRASGLRRLVVGVSGGLDSTLALLVAIRAAASLDLPSENVLAYTMPGFGTSERTLGNARALMAALAVSADEIDIRPAAERMLRDIGHPAADGSPEYDITYENVQAGERTSHLFRLANMRQALVVGTGDLSELALGWCTYGVGDQMSHYAVNASVPKTLVRFLIAWLAADPACDAPTAAVLRAVIETPISPELLPREPGGTGAGSDEGPAHDSERVVGPYELVDFFLYHLLRFGMRPSKVAFLAQQAWGDRTRGDWPDLVGEEHRREFAPAEIKHWLGIFLKRFFQQSQFKRSAMPNAPKIGSGGSLSPRGDWRAPSDSSAAVWLRELEHNCPDL